MADPRLRKDVATRSGPKAGHANANALGPREPVPDGNALMLEMFRCPPPRPRERLAAVLIALTFCALVPPVRAQTDASRGELIAVGGGPGGPQSACFTCHGIDGAGQAASGTPALAGIDAGYLTRQLDDYASGARANDIMTPIARALSSPERQAVALHYGRLRRNPVDIVSKPDPALLQEGASLYAMGSIDGAVEACISCHGPQARGLGPNPLLAGQPAPYTAEQLRHWQQGKRTNDPDGTMARVAKPMTARQVEAVAAYLESLVPSPDEGAAPMPGARSSRPDPSKDPP